MARHAIPFLPSIIKWQPATAKQPLPNSHGQTATAKLYSTDPSNQAFLASLDIPIEKQSSIG
jgi:hypothetical protein